MSMATWDTYNTFADFYTALRSGKLDATHLTVHLDGGDFFILDEQEQEVWSGDERAMLAPFFALMGLTTIVYETIDPEQRERDNTAIKAITHPQLPEPAPLLEGTLAYAQAMEEQVHTLHTCAVAACCSITVEDAVLRVEHANNMSFNTHFDMQGILQALWWMKPFCQMDFREAI